LDNLEVLTRRGALHAPIHMLVDALRYRICHDPRFAAWRQVKITVGPGGTIRDYASFSIWLFYR
jgi:hypothetical protein